ncbi:MAG: RNA-binding protein [Betaproteobacteria bacterium RIFCSPLOWO2_12_FULL_63_13]|nr:MAG: RNA-binding protein [Betaproteobacteria bacterium RIFCSPLOWO2_12_FULL_63_13]
MTEKLRIDKWLWAARFFKTRSLAVRAIEGGKVRLNQLRVKPAKDLKPGDELVIQIGELEWTVNVVELSERRGPAPVASRLYTETVPSRERRMAAVEARRLQGAPLRGERGRPTKKDRRMIRRFTEGA